MASGPFDFSSSLAPQPTDPNLGQNVTPDLAAFNTSSPTVTSPTTPSTTSLGTAPTAPGSDAIAKHTLGRAIGAAFTGLSGYNHEYSVDPATGKTDIKTTKAPLGQWARGVLAAGLAGATGIDPEHGEHTLTQGLFAGLSGGARARGEQTSEEDAKKRQQAQLDYANKLKADEASRQNKELTMREQLDKAAIARDNQETALHASQLQDVLSNREGAASALQVESKKNIVQDYKEADLKPIQEGLTDDQMHEYLKQNPGSGSSNVGLPTGIISVKGQDGLYHPQTTYSIYSPLTTVSDGLVSRMKASGLDKSNPSMFKELEQANKNHSQVDYRKISTANQETGKQIVFQDLLDKHLEARSSILRNNSEQAAADIRRNKDKYDFQKEEDLDKGEKLYNARFNALTGDVDMKDLNKPDKDFLAGYLNKMNQYYTGELYKYEKKDENGNYSISDPAAVGISKSSNNIIRGLGILQGTVKPAPPGGEVQNLNTIQGLQNKVISDAPPQLGNVIRYFISDRQAKNAQGANVAIPAPTTLRDALKNLDDNQSNPSARLNPTDYEGVVKALTEYYQNVGPLQTSVVDNVTRENQQNRYVKLHALNPSVTPDNVDVYDDNGVRRFGRGVVK